MRKEAFFLKGAFAPEQLLERLFDHFVTGAVDESLDQLLGSEKQ